MSAFQISVLEESFAENVYPTKATLHMLREKLGVSEVRIKTWFFNQRQKVKHGKLKQRISIGKNICEYVTLQCTIGLKILYHARKKYLLTCMLHVIVKAWF